MFQCALCEKAFNNPWKLNKHTLSHTKEKPHKCPTCSASFGDRSNLTKHIKHVHDGVKKNRTVKNPLNCPKCTYECSGKDTMERHMRKHSEEFLCSVPGCGMKTKYKNSLSKHLRQVHSNERPYECSIAGCNYKAKTLFLLKLHLKIHSNERAFSCSSPECNYTAKTKQALRSHTHAIHSAGTLLKCSTCEFQTKYKSRLRKHEDEHKNIIRFRCTAPNCSYATNNRTTFGTHFDAKHREKRVICTVLGCSYRCGSINLLKRHLKKHTHPILRCPDASCKFSTRIPHVLRNHLSCRHKDGSFVPLVPPRQSHLPIVAPNDPVELLICAVPNCNYQTEFRHRYDRHVVAHDEGRRKYACKICSLRFTNSCQLKVHVQRHIGEKPYRCSHCNYTSERSDRLKSHAGNAHGIFLPAGEQPLIGVKKCHICHISCISYNELVLHSMSHLQAVVVLQRLHVKIL